MEDGGGFKEVGCKLAPGVTGDINIGTDAGRSEAGGFATGRIVGCGWRGLLELCVGLGSIHVLRMPPRKRLAVELESSI